MTFHKLSAKQKQVFKWCYKDGYKAIICDGAVRSGKTICMITSFILWAMDGFNGAIFGICGKTVRSAERNIIQPLQTIADITHYFRLSYTRSVNLTIEGNGHKNHFYVFGGKDESSYQLIQGITLSGVFFDEVALMPRSFVEQAVTRTISVENSKLWFNCNPDSSQHWFYKEWILQAEKRQALHLHFTMHDNPTLTETQINYAESQFSGVFYDRYIKGLWVLAEGLVYENWKDEFILDEYVPTAEAEYFISCDYGTANPCSMGLWALEYDKAVRISEYYHNGRTDHRKTDEEHYQALEKLADGRYINSVIVDPSAASFIECIRKHGKFKVRPAKNAVISGIRATATLISKKKIFVCRNCKDILKEFSLYRWDENSQEDKVIKENDHAMDDMRYFVNNILAPKMLRNIYRNGGENND